LRHAALGAIENAFLPASTKALHAPLPCLHQVLFACGECFGRPFGLLAMSAKKVFLLGKATFQLL